jgi:L-ribulose-5-phosphate 4-epimerase
VSETGSVKFLAECESSALIPFPGLGELNRVRSLLRRENWLGVDEAGIGFGNISVRDAQTNCFWITGSNTGHKTELAARDCARVTSCNLKANSLRYEGEIVPSSESLSHAVIYASVPVVGAVIHCHSAVLWTQLMEKNLSTSSGVAYGTPEMAAAVSDLLVRDGPKQEGAFAMAGHENGVIGFGPDLEGAWSALRSHG